MVMPLNVLEKSINKRVQLLLEETRSRYTDTTLVETLKLAGGDGEKDPY